MLMSKASEMIHHHHHHEEAEGGAGHSCCGHDHRHSESFRLGLAMFGGILVLNSYIGRTFFATAIDPFAIELSAIAGALILSFPIFSSAVRDLVAGKVYMNELVTLALIAVAGLAMWAYVWWKTRELRKAMKQRPAGGHVIDGEAIVVDESRSTLIVNDVELPEKPD